MRVIATAIPEVLILEPDLFQDERGWFRETWQAARFRAAGLDWEFVQDNHSRSRTGTLRGLHYQIEQAQGKLVWVVAGAVFDVAVDLRRSSPTFGRWVGVVLTADNNRQVWIPAGFAHGFYVTAGPADLLYKCTTPYAAEYDRTLRWDDAALAIEWPIARGVTPLISEKDARGSPLRDAPVYP
ncbi:MAG TPA: dTDP-4-dehydrorhamnose 3,5-epimerase [Gemmatimonadales bacterium]|nr:dTDP-4-dehydrorhamnose 3,5-epimerase [Gemmatimonadales bacterium]